MSSGFDLGLSESWKTRNLMIEVKSSMILFKGVRKKKQAHPIFKTLGLFFLHFQPGRDLLRSLVYS